MKDSSHPVPEGMKQLLQQHSEDDALAGDGSTYPATIQIEDIFRSFTDCARIYGYMTPEYMRKWKEFFGYLAYHIDWNYDERDLWAMFYCEDSECVYTLMWDHESKSVDVRKACNLTCGK